MAGEYRPHSVFIEICEPFYESTVAPGEVITILSSYRYFRLTEVWLLIGMLDQMVMRLIDILHLEFLSILFLWGHDDSSEHRHESAKEDRSKDHQDKGRRDNHFVVLLREAVIETIIRARVVAFIGDSHH